MPTRSLNVAITADDRDLQRALKRSSGALDKFGKDTTLHGRITSKGFSGIGIAARGMGAAVVGATAGVGFLTKQFVESNKVSQQTTAVLKSTGGAAHVTAKQVSDLATAISRKTGIDDEAIQSGENLLLTFTNIRNEAGRGNRIFTQATRVLSDMSVALGQDTKSSAIQLGKALNDPIKGVTALQRVGVSFTASQKEQIKTLVESGRTLDAQKLILRELNKEFGGSAAAQATPFDKLKVSAGNLAETLGGFLAPALGKAAAVTNRFLNQMQDGTGAGGKFVHTVVNVANALKGAWQTAVAAVSRFLARHQADIESVRKTMRNLAVAAKFVFQEIMLPVIKKVVEAIVPVLQGLLQMLRGVVRFITGVLTGDWRRAWGGLKDIAVGQLKAVFNVVKGAGAILLELAKRLGGAIIKGLVAGLKGLAGAIKDAIVHGVTAGVNAAKDAVGSVISKINPFGDGIGRVAKNIGDGMGTLAPAGSSGAGLMGADFDLAPFARIGASMGLHVSSGLRPGATTISGNPSYHGSGDAIDEVGPFAAMRRYASTMFHNFGGRLRELISPFPQFGIKDGRPYRYDAAVQAQHSGSNAHVHVAYTGPFGDGLGKFVSTSYGPPWGGIQGGGVTATGVNLKGSPHTYGIAVDPSRLKLGKNYYVWPNPFGRKGPFRAFDTGGAIKGNRIDFYDWRGRAAQMGWGRQQVTISDDPALNISGGGRRSGGHPVLPMTPQQRSQQVRDNAVDAERTAVANARAGRRRGRVGPTGLPVRAPGKGGDGTVADTGTGAEGDPNQPLIDALTAATEAEKAHTDALNSVGGELKRQTDLAQQWAGTSEFQKTKYIADLISGHLGQEALRRGFTPGVGKLANY